MSLDAGMEAQRLGFEPGDWDLSLKGRGSTKKDKEEEKIILCEL